MEKNKSPQNRSSSRGSASASASGRGRRTRGGASRGTKITQPTPVQQAWTLPGPLGSAAARMVSVAAVPAARVRQVADARGGLPVYVGAGGMAALGVLGWPAALGVGVGYVALRHWGGRLPEPLRSLTGSRPTQHD